MYCPKCGQQQVSEEVRFCARCGFTLAAVKAGLAGDEVALATPTSPPHSDINSGVALMLLGVLFTGGAVLLGGIGPAAAFGLLTVTFIFILLSSRHLVQALYRLLSREGTAAGDVSDGRRGMSFGALLMYVGAILSACAATLVPGRMGVPAFFLTLLMVFPLLLLFSRHLMQSVLELVSGETPRPAGLPRTRVTTASLPDVSGDVSALPPARVMPMTFPDAQHAVPAEMAAPPSVTERTTALLNDKQAGGV